MRALLFVQRGDGARPFPGSVRGRPRAGRRRARAATSLAGRPAAVLEAGLGRVGRSYTLPGADRKMPIPLFTRLLTDDMIEPLLQSDVAAWERARSLMSDIGAPVASIWRADDGSVFLPFDPNEVVESFWTERYLGTAGGQRMLRSSPRVDAGLLPGRGRCCRGPCRSGCAAGSPACRPGSPFPRWPVETCLHDFFELMFAILAGISGRADPLHRAVAGRPHVGPRPDARRGAGRRPRGGRPGSRARAAPRSAIVVEPRAERYEIDPCCVSDLIDAGVRGRRPRHLPRRAGPRVVVDVAAPPSDRHEAAERWNAVGFRSAALHRHSDWMQSLDSTTTRPRRTRIRSSRRTVAAARGCPSSTARSSSCR